jgi:hypothetical protein
MKYISTYFTSFTLVLLAIASFNWFIDPFGMYWSPVIENINEVKPKAGTRSRITKAYQINKIKPQILIVGNSRVEMGLDPNNNIFEDKIVYNQGMPGASVAMQVDYAIDAIANNNTIEQVLVGVDFIDFLLSEQQVISFRPKTINRIKAGYDFRLTSLDSNNFSNIARLKESLAMVFSIDAFIASTSTVLQQKHMASSISSLGFNNALSYVAIMNSEGIKPLFNQKLHEISTRLTSKPWSIKAQDSFPYSPTFTHLGRLIKIAKQKKINIKFFINPYHFSYLHTLNDHNQWKNFKEWKDTLVSYLSTQQGNSFTLWDFSGASGFINEAVPLANPKQQMQWFWEPAHYKKELGDILLARLLEKETNNSISFGKRLTEENIASLLKINQESLLGHSASWIKLQDEL